METSRKTSNSPERLIISMPTVAEDEAIDAAAQADPDAPPLTAEQLKALVPLLEWRSRHSRNTRR